MCGLRRRRCGSSSPWRSLSSISHHLLIIHLHHSPDPANIAAYNGTLETLIGHEAEYDRVEARASEVACASWERISSSDQRVLRHNLALRSFLANQIQMQAVEAIAEGGPAVRGYGYTFKEVVKSGV